jgi:hypothetical protein
MVTETLTPADSATPFLKGGFFFYKNATANLQFHKNALKNFEAFQFFSAPLKYKENSFWTGPKAIALP